MYSLQFHSVKEPSTNHDIWVQVLFGSRSCTFFTCATLC